MKLNWKIGGLLVLILLAGSFLRIFDLSGLPPGLYPDEAMNGNNALEALRTAPPDGGYKSFYPENNGREGLFINIQAFVLAPLIAGGQLPEAWMLRIPSVFFGILTLLGVFFLTRELFRKNGVALLATLFLATSFWHINFSRIAFRAIMAPCFLVWGVFLLLYVFRKLEIKALSVEQNPKHQTLNPKQIQNSNDKNSKPFGASDFGHWNLFRIWNLGFGISALAILAGAVYGLGMHSYIAYRATPLLVVFVCWLAVAKHGWKTVLKIFSLFVLGAIIVSLPLIVHFAQNPQDLFGRTSELSIFSSAAPLQNLGTNIIKTAGMFFFSGDTNWRHNVAGLPELFWPMALLFAVGLILGIVALANPKSKYQDEKLFDAWHLKFGISLLFAWLVVGALPEIFSNEGIPHALRGILMLPPAIMLAAWAGGILHSWFRSKNVPKILITTLVSLFVFVLLIQGYYNYFIVWGTNHAAAEAFTENYTETAAVLNELPQALQKYVVVSAPGTLVHGIPMPAETVMYLTDTYSPEARTRKNIHYILPSEKETIPPGAFAVNLQ